LAVKGFQTQDLLPTRIPVPGRIAVVETEIMAKTTASDPETKIGIAGAIATGHYST
jgi:hypothetical protein